MHYFAHLARIGTVRAYMICSYLRNKKAKAEAERKPSKGLKLSAHTSRFPTLSLDRLRTTQGTSNRQEPLSSFLTHPLLGAQGIADYQRRGAQVLLNLSSERAGFKASK
jgi:hypothetical protein